MIEPFAEALEREPDLRMIIVVPRFPDQDGWLAGPASLIGRSEALARLMHAGEDRVVICDLENHEGTPVYVHAKVCVVDDVWAAVGSDNPGDVGDLCDPVAAFEAFAESAARLDAWHRQDRRGPRPPGRVRVHPAPELDRVRKTLAMPLYRLVIDPDGRPPRMRRSREF